MARSNGLSHEAGVMMNQFNQIRAGIPKLKDYEGSRFRGLRYDDDNHEVRLVTSREVETTLCIEPLSVKMIRQLIRESSGDDAELFCKKIARFQTGVLVLKECRGMEFLYMNIINNKVWAHVLDPENDKRKYVGLAHETFSRLLNAP